MMKKVMWVQILIQAGVLCNTKAHQLQIRFFVEMLSGQWLLTNSFIHVLSLPFLTCLISSSSDYTGSCVGDMTEDFPSSD